MDYSHFKNDVCSKCIANLVPGENVTELIEYCEVVEGVTCQNGTIALQVVLQPIFDNFCKFSILKQIESLLSAILGEKVYENVHKSVTAMVSSGVDLSFQSKNVCANPTPLTTDTEVANPVTNTDSCNLTNDLTTVDMGLNSVNNVNTYENPHRLLSPFHSLFFLTEEPKINISDQPDCVDNTIPELHLQDTSCNTPKHTTSKDNYPPMLEKCRNLSDFDEEEDDDSIVSDDSSHTPPLAKKRKIDLKLPKLDLSATEDDYQKLLHSVQQKYNSWSSKVTSSAEKVVAEHQRVINDWTTLSNKVKKLQEHVGKIIEKSIPRISQKMAKFEQDFTAMHHATVEKVLPECRENLCIMHHMTCISKVVEPPRGHISGQLNKKKGLITKN
jgi:hypothetical protein